jgi:hypothetical protein
MKKDKKISDPANYSSPAPALPLAQAACAPTLPTANGITAGFTRSRKSV